MAMALRSLAVKQSGGSSLVFLLSSAARRPFSAAPRRLPVIRPLVALADHIKAAPFPRRRPEGFRCFSSSRTSSSLDDPSPNWSNRPPKETILLDGCDFEHWLVVVEPPDPSLTRDEIIKSYIQTLAKVVGSEEEARFKIYSVSTKHYFAFGALVSEELSYKLKELPGVRWVLPDSYLDVKNKDYGGEPFINGEAVPYDPKYHEEWVRNNARAMERNRRNDRPRNFDRSRNFERRRENMQNFQNRAPPPPFMQSQNQGPANPVNMPGQGPMPPPPMPGQNPQNAVPPMQSQNLVNQPNQGPVNPVNMPGQGPMPHPPTPGQNPQNAVPSPNMGGPNYMGYQNQMPGQNPIPPPMPGQGGHQPGMPPRTAPNYGYQNQVPNYQSGPPQPNQSYYNIGGNPYQRSAYPPGANAYQGPNDHQGGPPTYQAPQNAYQPNPGAHQGPPNSYQGNAYQGGDGSNSSSPYQGQGQGQDLTGRRN